MNRRRFLSRWGAGLAATTGAMTIPGFGLMAQGEVLSNREPLTAIDDGRSGLVCMDICTTSFNDDSPFFVRDCLEYPANLIRIWIGESDAVRVSRLARGSYTNKGGLTNPLPWASASEVIIIFAVLRPDAGRYAEALLDTAARHSATGATVVSIIPERFPWEYPPDFDAGERTLFNRQLRLAASRYSDTVVDLPATVLDATRDSELLAIARREQMIERALMLLMGSITANQAGIAVDFADVKLILESSQYARIGSGLSSGPDRVGNALRTAVSAISCGTAAIDNCSHVIVGLHLSIHGDLLNTIFAAFDWAKGRFDTSGYLLVAYYDAQWLDPDACLIDVMIGGSRDFV